VLFSNFPPKPKPTGPTTKDGGTLLDATSFRPEVLG